MKFFVSAFVLALLTAAFDPVASNPADDTPPTQRRSGDIIVGFRTDTNRDDAIDFIATTLQEARDEGLSDCETEPVYESDGAFQVLRVGENNEDTVIKKLEGGIEYFSFIQPDYIYSFGAIPSDDPLASSQYVINNLSLHDAWGISTGSADVTIGVCDTGIDVDHPDLAANMLEGYNALTQTWGDDVSTLYDNDHGTAVAGSAAAVTNNGEGIAGMGWTLKHRAGQVSTGPGTSTSSMIADCIWKMCQKEDVRVVNVSWSGVYDTARHVVANECRKDYNTIVVNAAGNSFERVYGDADKDSIIFAGATDMYDNPASFTNYGDLVDVWAPGVDILTTRDDSVSGNTLYSPTISGTSFSAPIVAGVIGLMWAANPDLTADEVEAMLKQSSDQLPSLDGWGGYGRVNAFEAVKLATGTTTLSPTSAPECEEEIVLEYVLDSWGLFENTIALVDGYDIIYVRRSDLCYTQFTETLGSLCTNTNYKVVVLDSFGDGLGQCGGEEYIGCTNTCQPPYVKVSWKKNGQTLAHLTGFTGRSVEMTFTLPGKETKGTKETKAPKRARKRTRH